MKAEDRRALETVPKYSTDMSAALDVLEVLMSKGYEIRIGASDENFYCRVSTSDNSLAIVDCREKTMPLAICRAALETIVKSSL